MASMSVCNMVSARSGESLNATGSVIGKNMTASARAKSVARRSSDLGAMDLSETSSEGRKRGKVTPDPSFMSSHGAIGAVSGEPCRCLRCSKVSCIVLPQEARPPEEGLRRYHRPEPMTKSEEGVDGIEERYEMVCDVLRYGSL